MTLNPGIRALYLGIRRAGGLAQPIMRYIKLRVHSAITRIRAYTNSSGDKLSTTIIPKSRFTAIQWTVDNMDGTA